MSTDRRGQMVEIKEITMDFLEAGLPKTGRLVFEENFDYRMHIEEIETAKWLLETFGGDIVLLCESKKQREKMPDYLWRGKYWERKGIVAANENTIDVRIRKAYEQIDFCRGGIILDFTGNMWNMTQIEKAVKHSLLRRAKGTIEMILIKRNEYKIFRVVKK